MFQNRVPRRKFGPKRDETWEWRRFHSEELLSLYSSPNIVRKVKSRILRLARACIQNEQGRSAFKILTGKHSGTPNIVRVIISRILR